MQRPKRVKHNKIRLWPTGFYLHVFLYGESLQQLKNAFTRAMPADKWEVYFSTIESSDTAFVESICTDTEGKTIVMVIKEPKANVIAHEVVHVLNHLSGYTGIEVGREAQEWNAYFQDYLFEEIYKMIKRR